MHDGLLHQRLDVERAQIGEENEEADRHGRVADPGDDERLARGEPVGGIAIPEADQEIAAEADALPAEIEEQQVVRQDQHQHRGDEQVHIGEVAAVSLVRAHELGGIEVDEKADEGDDQHHQTRQRVEIEADMRREAGDGDPGPDDFGVGLRRAQEGEHDDQRQERRDTDGADANRRDPALRQQAGGHEQDGEAEEWESRDECQEAEHISLASCPRHRHRACRAAGKAAG